MVRQIPGSTDPKVQRGSKAYPDHRVRQDHKVQTDRKDHVDHKDRQVHKVRKAKPGW